MLSVGIADRRGMPAHIQGFAYVFPLA
jgi:hypothetical protein